MSMLCGYCGCMYLCRYCKHFDIHYAFSISGHQNLDKAEILSSVTKVLFRSEASAIINSAFRSYVSHLIKIMQIALNQQDPSEFGLCVVVSDLITTTWINQSNYWMGSISCYFYCLQQGTDHLTQSPPHVSAPHVSPCWVLMWTQQNHKKAHNYDSLCWNFSGTKGPLKWGVLLLLGLGDYWAFYSVTLIRWKFVWTKQAKKECGLAMA